MKQAHYFLFLVLIACSGSGENVEKSMRDYYLELPIYDYEDTDDYFTNQAKMEILNTRDDLIIDEDDRYFELGESESQVRIKVFGEGTIALGTYEFSPDCNGQFIISFFWDTGEGLEMLDQEPGDEIPLDEFWEGEVPEVVSLHAGSVRIQKKLTREGFIASLDTEGAYCFAMDSSEEIPDEYDNPEYDLFYQHIRHRTYSEIIYAWEDGNFVLAEKIPNTLDSEARLLSDKAEIVAFLDSLGAMPYGDIDTNIEYRLIDIRGSEGDYLVSPCGPSDIFASLGKNDEYFASDGIDYPALLLYSPFDTYIFTIEELAYYSNLNSLSIRTSTENGAGYPYEYISITYNENLEAWIYQLTPNYKLGFVSELKDLEKYKADCDEESDMDDENEEELDPRFANLDPLIDITWLPENADDSETGTVLFTKRDNVYYFQGASIRRWDDEIENRFLSACDPEDPVGASCDFWELEIISENKIKLDQWVHAALNDDDNAIFYVKK